MDEITSTQLQEDISDILRGSDITTVTSKKIRKQLEEKYGCDLIERKSEIDKICMDEIVNLTKKNDKSNGKGNSDSEASPSEDEDDAPPAKKSKPSKGVKSKGSSDDNDDAEDDEDLARRLQEEEENGSRRTRHGAKPQKIKKKRKKPKSSDEGSDDEDSSKKKKKSKGTGRTNKYTEPCYLSPQLAAIMDETRLKRSDVVKKMWAIVKERNLYDPKNKQFMICDEQMQTVFGCKRVRIFGMMKSLKNHIFSPDEYEQQMKS